MMSKMEVRKAVKLLKCLDVKMIWVGEGGAAGNIFVRRNDGHLEKFITLKAVEEAFLSSFDYIYN